jgi:hypothetical protein
VVGDLEDGLGKRGVVHLTQMVPATLLLREERVE